MKHQEPLQSIRQKRQVDHKKSHEFPAKDGSPTLKHLSLIARADAGSAPGFCDCLGSPRGLGREAPAMSFAAETGFHRIGGR